jgi:hypothetical protein
MTFSDPLHHLLDTLDCLLRRAQSASRSKPSPKAVAGRRKSAEAVDESETGPANFFGPAQSAPATTLGSLTVHLRLPAIEPGVKAFVWALLLGLYIWAFMLAVGVDKGTSTVLALIAFAAIFLCVRIYGESEES